MRGTVVGTAVALLLFGCVSIQPGTKDATTCYEGEKRRIEDVTILTTGNRLVFEKCGDHTFDFRHPRSSVAVLPGPVDVAVYARLPLNKGAGYIVSQSTNLSIRAEAGKKLLISGSWLLPNQTESMSSWVMNREGKILPLNEKLRPCIDLEFQGKRAVFTPTVMDVTTGEDVKRIISSPRDWRVRRDAIGQCSDAAFLAEFATSEPNREARAAAIQRANELSGKRLLPDTVFTYVGTLEGAKPATVRVCPGRPEIKGIVPMIDGIYDPLYLDARKLKFAPGKHTMRLIVYGGLTPWDTEATFAVREGCTYEFKWSVPVFPPYRLHFSVRDTDTDEVVASSD